ncbi:MAG: hypothetical protein HZA60_06260 [Deltaproteobacteria bacterium]|nr:hypothetical protein [Deltaproteobacteria bacterium]
MALFAALRLGVFAALSGGRAAVQEFLLNEDKAAPREAALFSLHMVAVTEGGRAYTAGEISSMLKAVGFRRISRDAPDPRGVGTVTGTC